MRIDICKRCGCHNPFFSMDRRDGMKMCWFPKNGRGIIRMEECRLLVKDSVDKNDLTSMMQGNRPVDSDQVYWSFEPSRDCPFYCEHFLAEVYNE